MAKQYQRNNGDVVQNQRKNGNYVPWVIFVFVVMVLLGLISGLGTRQIKLYSKIENVEIRSADMNEKIGRIDENIEWIKEAIKDLRR